MPFLKLRIAFLKVGMLFLKLRIPFLKVGIPFLKLRIPFLKVGIPFLKLRRGFFVSTGFCWFRGGLEGLICPCFNPLAPILTSGSSKKSPISGSHYHRTSAVTKLVILYENQQVSIGCSLSFSRVILNVVLFKCCQLLVLQDKVKCFCFCKLK